MDGMSYKIEILNVIITQIILKSASLLIYILNNPNLCIHKVNIKNIVDICLLDAPLQPSVLQV